MFGKKKKDKRQPAYDKKQNLTEKSKKRKNALSDSMDEDEFEDLMEDLDNYS